MSIRERIKSMEDQAWLPQQDVENPSEKQIELTPGYDGYYPEELPNEHFAEQSFEKSPLAILDEIKKNPSPRGAYPTMIGGRPVDLHILEDYLLKISPYSLKTILRYHQARTIEELRRYGKGTGSKFNSKIIWIILIIAFVLIGGIALIMFMPNITQSLGGALGVNTG